MCGIVGFLAPKKTKRSKDYFKMISELLAVDTIRGSHSTGVAVIPINKEKEKKVFKDTVPGYDFIDLKGYTDLAPMMEEGVLVIGHNRFATHGTISQPNAHPFEVNHITLVHNGVVTNKDDLESGVVSDVDSHHITGSISKNGWDKSLPKIDGSAILVWHDSSDHTLHFSRTRSRDLYLCYDEHGTLWFASQGEMIEWVASKHKLKLKDPMMCPQEFTHYSCALDKPSAYTKTKFEEFKPRWVKEREAWEAGHRTGSHQHGQQGVSSRLPRWKAQQEARREYNSATDTVGEPNLGEARTPRTIPLPTSLKPGASTSTASTGAATTRSERFIARTEHIIYDAKAGVYVPLSRNVAERPGTYEPQGTNKRRRMQENLHDEGFELDEQVDVQPYMWHPESKNPGNGYISAVFAGFTDPVEFRIYNCREGNWKDRDPFGCIRAVVTGVQDIVENRGRRKVITAKPWIPRLEELVYGPNKTLIPKDIFEDIAKEGCLYCTKEVSIRNHDRVSWDSEHKGGPVQLVCEDCTGQLKTQEEKARLH